DRVEDPRYLEARLRSLYHVRARLFQQLRQAEGLIVLLEQAGRCWEPPSPQLLPELTLFRSNLTLGYFFAPGWKVENEPRFYTGREFTPSHKLVKFAPFGAGISGCLTAAVPGGAHRSYPLGPMSAEEQGLWLKGPLLRGGAS
ncbi:MAG: hypothetical protein ABDI20_02230, partial [Candidatus Bipolaricaulaceae bacterium]